MSIGSLGVIGSVTTGQLQQARSADTDRVTNDARAQSQTTDSAQQAEAAEGVGEMAEDEPSSDRDADGRRLWERPARRLPPDDDRGTESQPTPQSVDPTGESGGRLDLTG